MLSRLPSCTHPWGGVPSTEHPAQSTQPLSAPTGKALGISLGAHPGHHTGEPVQEQGPWHPAVVVSAQLNVALKASPAPGDRGATRASREAQLPRAPSPKLGPSQKEKWTLPGAVRRAEPKERPAGADPASTLPAQWLMETK